MIKNLLKLFLESLALWISTSQTTIRDFLNRRGCCILSRLEALLCWIEPSLPVLYIIILLIVIYILFFLDILVLSWFSADTFISIYPLIIQAPHKKFFSTVSDKNPWIKYRDPFNSKTNDHESIKKFLRKFFKEAVSNCPLNHNIQFIFKDRWSTANLSKERILHLFFEKENRFMDFDAPKFLYRTLSDILTVNVEDVIYNTHDTFSTILNEILSNNDDIYEMLDFESMFILYRYVPNKNSVSPNRTMWGGDSLSKRYYSTTRHQTVVAKKNYWKVYNDPEEFMGLNRDRIKLFLDNFFKDIISPCEPGQFFYLIFKVRFIANSEDALDLKDWKWENDNAEERYITRSFSRLQKLEYIPELQEDKIKKLLSVIMFHVNNNSENYNELLIHNFFVMYKLVNPIYSPEGLVINNPTPIKSSSPLNRSDINKLEILDLESKGIKPTMDIETWSENMKFSNDLPTFFIRDSSVYSFDISESSYICEVNDSEDKLIIKFRDSLIGKEPFTQGGLDTFTREILVKDQEGEEVISKKYHYLDGVLQKTDWFRRSTAFIENPNIKAKKVGGIADTLGKRSYSTSSIPLAPANTTKSNEISPLDIGILLNKDFDCLTLDLETRKLSNNKLEVISNCIYDGKHYKTFYLTDYEMNQDLLLKASVDYLLKPIYNKCCIYIHNLSHFDGIFILKSIVDLKKIGYTIKLLYKDGYWFCNICFF